MKGMRIGVWAAAALVLSVAGSCKRTAKVAENLDIVDSIGYNIHDHADRLQGTNLLEYDSLRFSDGSIAVYRLANAPLNSLTEYRDQNGRVMATISNASECDAQLMIRRYDDQGRLVHLVVGYEILDVEDEEVSEYWMGDGSVSPYLAFRRRMEKLDYARPDTARYKQYDMTYNDEGDVVKVTKALSSEVIEAPEGYKLDVSAEPCNSFWESDLDGGVYVFKVAVRPVNADQSEYTIMRYADFVPAIEQNFRNGILERIVMYPEPSYPDSKRMVVTREDKGDSHLYTSKFDGNDQSYQTEWRDGLKRYEQTVSQYGTVLKKTSYEYSLPSTRVKAVLEVIDYATGKLKTDKVEFVEQVDLGREEDEMDLIQAGWIWINAYDSDDCLKGL